MAQLTGAAQNSRLLAASGSGLGRVQLLWGDARRLPMAAGSVDAIICDVPFGRQFLTLEECRNGLYDGIMEEFDRVLVKTPAGRVVLLCSMEQEAWLLKAAGFPPQGGGGRMQWRCVARRELRLGPLEAVLIVLRRPQDQQGPHDLPEL